MRVAPDSHKNGAIQCVRIMIIDDRQKADHPIVIVRGVTELSGMHGADTLPDKQKKNGQGAGLSPDGCVHCRRRVHARRKSVNRRQQGVR